MHNEKAPARRKRAPLSSVFRGRIWIDGPEGTFIGWGRVTLLEKIKEHGSITKAAKSMAMAYRHAWDLVDSMNRQSKRPFVEVSTGGKGGGGARVTEEGEEAIKLFWKFHDDFQKFLMKEQTKLLPILARKRRRL
ncbi:MAG TPA: ModE family transcriptional regulator [Nitrospirota bacterium]